MFPFFPYLFIAIGIAALVMDVRGRFVVEPPRLRVFQWIGIAAASGPCLAPAIAWLIGRLEAGPPFTLVAAAYVVAFVLFTVGVLRRAGEPRSTTLRRVGYGLLLAVASLPGWVLVIFAPLVALAAAGLAQVRPAE